MAIGARFHSGEYKVINKEKFLGTVNPSFRSSWELHCMRFFDHNPNVLKWDSEGVIVPYYSPADERERRYIVDFYVEYRDKQGKIIKELIECKPYVETQPPKNTKRKKKSTYLNEVYTYNVNIAKWKAASEYARLRKWNFRILTERELFR